MNTMDSNFFFLSCERPLGYPNAQISPAKSSSLVDNARYCLLALRLLFRWVLVF